MQDLMEKNRRALEEEFFTRHNQELLQKMKEEKIKSEAIQQLTDLTGIKDRNLLEQLTQRGISASTLMALTQVPLVLVAWADGVIDPTERAAVLKALEEQGLEPQQPSYELLQGWLDNPPSTQLFETWKTYVKGLRAALHAHDFELLKATIMKRALAVAESTGGFLGLGSKISSAEREQFRLLEAAFSA